MSNCKPVLIATDVPKVPVSVKKIASTFGIKVWSPKEDISIYEKENLVKNLYNNSKNSHSRDAISAAFFALKKHKELFDHIKSHLKKKNQLKKFDAAALEILAHPESFDVGSVAFTGPFFVFSAEKELIFSNNYCLKDLELPNSCKTTFWNKFKN